MQVDENARFDTADGRPQSMGVIRAMRSLPHIPADVRELLVKLANEVDDLRAARSAEPVAWEFFQDEGYFGMWCVREVGASRFGDGFHVVSQEEARALKTALSAAAIRKGSGE